MKIPPGMTFTVGRKEYSEGMELPAGAPESVKKKCADYAAELAKKAKEADKPAVDKNQQQGDGGK